MSGVALVTGGAGALGSAIVAELGRAGHRVVLAYRSREDAARRIVDALGGAGHAVAVRADLARAGAAATVVAAAEREFGPVTVLVNNAGTMPHALVEEMTDDQWDDVLAVNLTSAFRLCRAVVPGMRAAGGGRIVNISSQAAYRGSAGRAHYAAAKAGMLGLTYSLARELGPDAVTVNAVVPGRIESEMLGDYSGAKEREWLDQTPLGRLGTPAEVAGAVAYLASESAAYVTGAALQVGGGLVMG